MLQFFLGHSAKRVYPTGVAGAGAVGTPGISNVLLTNLIQVESISAGALGDLEIEVGAPVILPRGIGTQFLLFPVRVGSQTYQVSILSGQYQTLSLDGSEHHRNSGRVTGEVPKSHGLDGVEHPRNSGRVTGEVLNSQSLDGSENRNTGRVAIADSKQ